MSTPRRKPAFKRFLKSIERIAVTCKQRFIVHYLLNHAEGKSLIRQYAGMPPSETPITATSPIWTCWWQGEEAMPDIVRACYNAMRLHADNHPVILITEKNYKEYVDMPEYIIRKLKDGTIDLTHFSDILRMMLLQEQLERLCWLQGNRKQTAPAQALLLDRKGGGQQHNQHGVRPQAADIGRALHLNFQQQVAPAGQTNVGRGIDNTHHGHGPQYFAVAQRRHVLKGGSGNGIEDVHRDGIDPQLLERNGKFDALFFAFAHADDPS